MRTAWRFVLEIAIWIAVGAAVLSPIPVAAAPCDSLIGTWRWFTGGVVTVKADGNVTHDPGNDGTWECTDPAQGRVTIRWRLGGFVNRLVPSGDGRALRSTDPSQSYVTAQRIGAPRPGATSPQRPVEPPRRATTTPPPRTPPAATPPEQKTTVPNAAGAAPPPAVKAPQQPGQPGPCSGSVCLQVQIESVGSCVWLRSSVNDIVQAEIRLATESIRMTLERPDITKAANASNDTARGPVTTRRAPSSGADRSRAWHGTIYDPLTGRNRPVFHARIDRAGACVADPGEILSYRVTPASPEPEAPERTIACTGDACADVDRSLEQIRACQLSNRGKRDIAVGIARPGNPEVSINGVLPAGGVMRLTSFIGCLRADDIGRIEARYR